MPTTQIIETKAAAPILADARLTRGRMLWIQQDRPLEILLPRARNQSDDDAARRSPTMRADNAAASGGYGYSVAGGIATFGVTGLLVPLEYASWFYADEITVTDLLAADVRHAMADPNVLGAMFYINSPGGFVDGAYELSEAIAALSAVKPTASFGRAIVASAAYLQASMTGRITAYKTTEVGSIGTRSAIYDWHEYFHRLGVRAIPIDSGGMKSAGLPGTIVTEEQVAYFKGLVLKLNDFFVDAVAAGRKMPREQVQALADGRVHLAADAMAIGLIDAVGETNDAIQELMARVQRGPDRPAATAAADPTTKPTTAEAATDAGERSPDAAGAEADPQAGAQAPEKGSDMSQTTTTAPSPTSPESQTAKPASVAEIKAACPGASSDFVLECAEKGMTIQAAKDAFIQWQAAQIRQRDTELSQAKEQKPAAAGTGLAPVRTNAADGSAAGGQDAVEAFSLAVAEKMKQPGYSDRKKAIAAVCKADPELHQAYLAATNAPGRVQQMIKEKFAAA